MIVLQGQEIIPTVGIGQKQEKSYCENWTKPATSLPFYNPIFQDDLEPVLFKLADINRFEVILENAL